MRCCLLALEDKFTEKDLEFDADLEEIILTTDESLMEIVWNNLLTNAIKFTEPKGSIKVELKLQKKQAVVTISDTGCGMNEETSRRILIASIREILLILQKETDWDFLWSLV